MMVFVASQKNLSKFKYHSNLADIPQFVMCPDKVVEGERKFSELSALDALHIYMLTKIEQR
jgi:hypothetical protein